MNCRKIHKYPLIRYSSVCVFFCDEELGRACTFLLLTYTQTALNRVISSSGAAGATVSSRSALDDSNQDILKKVS